MLDDTSSGGQPPRPRRTFRQGVLLGLSAASAALGDMVMQGVTTRMTGPEALLAAQEALANAYVEFEEDEE